MVSEMGSNRDMVDAWAAGFEPSPRAACLIRLAQTLADEMDSGEWTAPVARELRVTLDEIAVLLAGEGEDDGEAGLRLLMSTPVRDSA